MGLLRDADQPDYKVFDSIKNYRITAERLLVAADCHLLDACEGPLSGTPLPIIVIFSGGGATGPGIFPSLALFMLL